MRETDDCELLFDVPLDLDEEAVTERGEAIIADERIRLLLRENRIGLAKGKSVRVEAPEGAAPDTTLLHVPLTCIVHAHPDCQFRWSRLVVDLRPTKGARIRDMVPREVRGDKPVEIKTSIGVGFKFEAAAKALSLEAKPEYTTSRTVYYPEIVSSGVNFLQGYWDFLSKANGYLHANRDLHLLVSAPRDSQIVARFRLRAKVTLSGIAGLIPLLARTKEIDETYVL